MNILDLPTEILAIIVTDDLDTFLAALKAPGIGPRLCHEYIQNYAKNIFIKIVDDMWYTQYYLDGKLHRVGGPAVIRKEGWTLSGDPYTKKYDSISEYTNDEPIYTTSYTLFYRDKLPLVYVTRIEKYYIHDKHYNKYIYMKN